MWIAHKEFGLTHWLLYMVISMGGSPAITTVQFDTQKQCDEHLAEVNRRFYASSSYCKQVIKE
jgi:hypothetical protein